jgi:polysaccharide export outer membrane protein
MVALLGISTMGPGCQSGPRTPVMDGLTSHGNTDAFAVRNEADHPPRRLWSFFQSNRNEQVVEQAAAVSPVMPIGTPIATSPTLQGSYPVGLPAPAAQPAVMLQPVPRAAPPRELAIIASSWQPVQHLEAASGPDLVGTAEPDRRLVVETAPIGVIGRSPPAPALNGGNMLSAGQTGGHDPNGTALPSPRTVPPGTPIESTATLPPGLILPPEAYNPPPEVLYGQSHKGPFPAAHVPKEFRKQALPSYVVEPPDILLVQGSDAITRPEQGLQGQHLVRPDGTISLGLHGSVFVAGMTIEQIKDAIALQLQQGGGPEAPAKKLTLERIKRELDVDVLVYNSKFYYVITDGGGYGAQVLRLPITGNDSVLDALAQIGGLPSVASKKCMWVARATPGEVNPKILPVDWCGLTQRGSAATNYQIYPNDRIFVQSDPWIRGDSFLAKRLSPVLRVFGATLLGASTVNTIKSGTTPGGGGTGTR